MAPVLAIAGMVAKSGPSDCLFDPVGEILKPFVTGPNSILISIKEKRMLAEKPLRNRKERQTQDVFKQSLEQRDALCFQNEYSDDV
jgi:hypothetical protein